MKLIALGFIRIYQHTLSPDHGWPRFFYPYGFCRFYPTCSEYAYQAIKNLGFFSGVVLAVWHLLRCHPWARPRVEYPPRVYNHKTF